MHKVDMVIIQEPFLSSDQVEEYKRYLEFDQAIISDSNKIWCFWSNELNFNVIDKRKQQITLELDHNGSVFWITDIYARTNSIKSKGKTKRH